MAGMVGGDADSIDVDCGMIVDGFDLVEGGQMIGFRVEGLKGIMYVAKNIVSVRKPTQNNPSEAEVPYLTLTLSCISHLYMAFVACVMKTLPRKFVLVIT